MIQRKIEKATDGNPGLYLTNWNCCAIFAVSRLRRIMLQTQFKTQIPDQTQARCLSFYFSESGVREGSAVRPTPKWQRPLRFLLRSYQSSVPRLLLGECGSFFHHIGVILRIRKRPLPAPFSCCLSDYRLLLACNRDMTLLQKTFPWHGYLDVQLAFQAWLLGVEAHAHTHHNEECDKAQISS